MYQPTCMPFHMNPAWCPTGSWQQCWPYPWDTQDIEAMYPETYHIVYPCVRKECDLLEMQYGPMQAPSQAKMREMVDKIYARVEADVEATVKGDRDSKEDRQLGLGGRRVLRDLIAILLLREILRRRRPFGFFF